MEFVLTLTLCHKLLFVSADNLFRLRTYFSSPIKTFSLSISLSTDNMQITLCINQVACYKETI